MVTLFKFGFYLIIMLLAVAFFLDLMANKSVKDYFAAVLDAVGVLIMLLLLMCAILFI